MIPKRGPMIVTGAAGGVGSVAVALLAKLGYAVAASTGRPEEADYLKGLGADGDHRAQGTDRSGASRSPRNAGPAVSTPWARPRSPMCCR